MRDFELIPLPRLPVILTPEITNALIKLKPASGAIEQLINSKVDLLLSHTTIFRNCTDCCTSTSVLASCPFRFCHRCHDYQYTQMIGQYQHLLETVDPTTITFLTLTSKPLSVKYLEGTDIKHIISAWHSLQHSSLFKYATGTLRYVEVQLSRDYLYFTIQLNIIVQMKTASHQLKPVAINTHRHSADVFRAVVEKPPLASVDTFFHFLDMTQQQERGIDRLNHLALMSDPLRIYKTKPEQLHTYLVSSIHNAFYRITRLSPTGTLKPGAQIKTVHVCPECKSIHLTYGDRLYGDDPHPEWAECLIAE